MIEGLIVGGEEKGSIDSRLQETDYYFLLVSSNCVAKNVAWDIILTMTVDKHRVTYEFSQTDR